ncbi:hypothetical protein [Sporichthya sp.]|uniref:hypothetical protein n=1 Tax=Sporichthya sp. TaxID=65475 RepID=UPI00185441D2|nr:hypothetical protein [Sporichthya sp.]MBA3744021.1 hypothetical protein [Sporichthya sp.]
MAEPRFLLGAQSVAGRRERAIRLGWADASQPCFVWRLVGPNNRELGRSAQAYIDAAACRGGISFLRRQLDHLEVRVWCDDSTRWLWRLDLNGTPVANSARAYMRRRESVFNLEQFLAAVPIAGSPGLPRTPASTGTTTSTPLAVATSLTTEVAG